MRAFLFGTIAHMGKISEFLTGGSVTMKEVHSPINGALTVKWDMGMGYQIMGGGLWQVGGPVLFVWKTALKKVHFHRPVLKNVLILGLGGGSIAQLAREFWGEVPITGVDIDPVIVQLGRDYMNLGKLHVDIHIADAYKILEISKTKKYDLICIDTYVGEEFPEKFESDTFLKLVRSHLSVHGVAVFNRLYYGDKRKIADLFEKKLMKAFPSVFAMYPEVSALYIVSERELGQ